jgi:hypothetical protein
MKSQMKIIRHQRDELLLIKHVIESILSYSQRIDLSEMQWLVFRALAYKIINKCVFVRAVENCTYSHAELVLLYDILLIVKLPDDNHIIRQGIILGISKFVENIRHEIQNPSSSVIIQSQANTIKI